MKMKERLRFCQEWKFLELKEVTACFFWIIILYSTRRSWNRNKTTTRTITTITENICFAIFIAKIFECRKMCPMAPSKTGLCVADSVSYSKFYIILFIFILNVYYLFIFLMWYTIMLFQYGFPKSWEFPKFPECIYCLLLQCCKVF